MKLLSNGMASADLGQHPSLKRNERATGTVAGLVDGVGSIGAALTVGLRRGGMLIALLVLPFYMPVLIFGAGAVEAGLAGLPVAPFLAILGALFSLAAALGPFAIGAGLRISVDA